MSEVKLFSVGLGDRPAGGASVKSGEKSEAHHEKDMTKQLMHHLQNLNSQQENHLRLPMQGKFT